MPNEFTARWEPRITAESRLGLRDVVFSHIDVVEDYRQRRYVERQALRGSVAQREIEKLDRALAGGWSTEPVRLAYGAAELHIRSAQDHLGALGVLLATNLEDSLMTVGRGTAEASARAAWLLDPAIDGKRRVARTMTERLFRMDEMTRRDVRLNLERADDLDAAIQAIEQTAVQHGMGVARGERGRFVGEDAYPSATQAVELLFRRLGEGFGSRAYSDLSAVAHSALPAFARREPVIADPRARQVPADSAESQVVCRSVAIATAAYQMAVSGYFTLFGWQQGPWIAFLKDAQARMRDLMGVRLGRIDIVRVTQS